MQTIVGILTLMSGGNGILGLSEPKKAEFLDIFILMSILNCMLNLVEHEKSFITSGPGPKVIKLFSCSAQLNMKFFLLVNVKMPTMVGILTFRSVKNSILGLSDPKIRQFS